MWMAAFICGGYRTTYCIDLLANDLAVPPNGIKINNQYCVRRVGMTIIFKIGR